MILLTMESSITKYTKTWNAVVRCFISVLPLIIFILCTSETILASPGDKWDENIRPKIVTDYLKNTNAGKKCFFLGIILLFANIALNVNT